MAKKKQNPEEQDLSADHVLAGIEDYHRGVADTLTRHAWERDGVKYVGQTGLTLAEALDQAEAERRAKVAAAE